MENENIDEQLQEESYSDSGEEEITPIMLLETLENAWRNELSAPEILPHKQEMFDLMREQVKFLEDTLSQNAEQDFRTVTHRMELTRIRYLMANYLRTRIRKIEEFTEHILDEEQLRGEDEKRLTLEETVFAKEYLANVEAHLSKMALQHMPTTVRHRERPRRIVTPNLMAFTVLKANVELPGVVVDLDEEEVNMRVGSQHVMPYKLAADLVIKGDVQLV